MNRLCRNEQVCIGKESAEETRLEGGKLHTNRLCLSHPRARCQPTSDASRHALYALRRKSKTARPSWASWAMGSSWKTSPLFSFVHNVQHPLINSCLAVVGVVPQSCIQAVPKSLPHYQELQRETTSHSRQDERLSPPISLSHLCSGQVVSCGHHRSGCSWLPTSHPLSHPLLPSEMPGSKQQREKVSSVFLGLCLIIKLSKWKFRAPSHHICSILRCFIVLWEHEKAPRKEREHARNASTKHVCKYKEKPFSPFTLW